jgi:uncharacterized membrane protein
MERLKKLLRKLPHDEYAEAISYYEQYFADGGEINETPEQVARGILSDFATDTDKPGSMSRVWIIILSIFSMPILFPLAIAALALAIACYSVMFALAACGFAFAVSGIGGAVVSLVFIVESLPSAVFFFGSGLVFISAGISLVFGTWALTKVFSRCLLSLLGKMLGGVVHE